MPVAATAAARARDYLPRGRKSTGGRSSLPPSARRRGRRNFELSKTTAYDYMRMARNERDFRSGASKVSYGSIREMTGQSEREREHRQSKQQQDFRRVLRDVA